MTQEKEELNRIFLLDKLSGKDEREYLMINLIWFVKSLIESRIDENIGNISNSKFVNMIYKENEAAQKSHSNESLHRSNSSKSLAKTSNRSKYCRNNNKKNFVPSLMGFKTNTNLTFEIEETNPHSLKTLGEIEVLHFSKFILPTKPILYINSSQNEKKYEKYQHIIPDKTEKTITIKYNEPRPKSPEVVSNTNVIKQTLQKENIFNNYTTTLNEPISFYNEKDIFNWILDSNVKIPYSLDFYKQFSSGVLLADLVNKLENKDRRVNYFLLFRL